jgi:DNA-binding MarR family transcriptional regulator
MKVHDSVSATSARPLAQANQAIQTMQTIRRLFHALAGAAERSHAELGITASMCAVLETLHARGPCRVPQIAREKGVSRQHIQIVVNALLAADLVECLDNPDHLRSPLLRLNVAGTRAYEAIRRRETRLLSDLAKRIPAADLDVTLNTLNAMERGLNPLRAKPARAGSRV